jgi:hypothetical protein
MDKHTQNLYDMIQRMIELDGTEKQKQQLDEMASMNVSFSGDTAEEVASMAKLIGNAGMSEPAPQSAETMPMRQDMERLKGIMGGAEEAVEESDEECACCGEVHYGASHEDGPHECECCGETHDTGHSEEMEGYDNEPEEEYQDTEYMTKDLSGGLNRRKKSYADAEDGDNPMAVESVKDRLYAKLAEKKAKPDFLDVDKDGDKKEPMKKAVKDKKAKK